MNAPPYLWNVDFATSGGLFEVILTYLRLLPDGRTVKFDEDTDGRLDLAADEDDRLVMDGLLALIPDRAPVSCALRELRRVALVWEVEDYRPVLADWDKETVRTTLKGRLWNADSSADFVFAGGETSDHTGVAIRRWAKTLAD